MKLKIGYFVPEFPGQTHIFFWREKEALEELGIGIDVVSTRLPPKALVCHTSVNQAQRLTEYLTPVKFHDLTIGLIELLKAGPVGWFKCLTIVLRADDLPWTKRYRLLGLMLLAGKLVHLAKVKDWTHVHVHSCADSANIAMFASVISGLSYSLALHGPLSDYGPNQAQKWSYSAFALIITKQLYDEVQDQLPDSLPRIVEIAPMGVNLLVLQRQFPYVPWSNTNEPLYIFSCGRLNPCKGHADLITAVSLLRQQGFMVRLDIAGIDEQGGRGYRKILDQHIERLDLRDSVRLLGAVSEDVVRASLEKAHIFILASMNEPLGVAIMEAMAMQVPVIVTGSDGVKELIEDGVDGLLVEPQNPAMIVNAVKKLMQDSELSLRLSQNSRQKIAKKFSHQRSAKVLVHCLEQSLAKAVPAKNIV